MVLNGLELHLYNRSRTYARLERLFGLEQLLLGEAAEPEEPPDKGGGAADPFSSWRDLVPVIKADISTVRSRVIIRSAVCGKLLHKVSLK